MVLADTDEAQKVTVEGDESYGSREYILLPPNIQLPAAAATTATTTNSLEGGSDNEELLKQAIEGSQLASLRAHRNILFGAKVHYKNHHSNLTVDKDENIPLTMKHACGPFMSMALLDAGRNGEQPQALASLDGLSAWVRTLLDQYDHVDEQAVESVAWNSAVANDKDVLESVRAIATGQPRPGHKVLGMGTYEKGRVGWEALAREYATLEASQESQLYESQGGTLVKMEYLADRTPRYLQSAGGIMARYFFL
eukprot:scaffold3570_cov50-Attheya_sp.AAC.1